MRCVMRTGYVLLTAAGTLAALAGCGDRASVPPPLPPQRPGAQRPAAVPPALPAPQEPAYTFHDEMQGAISGRGRKAEIWTITLLLNRPSHLDPSRIRSVVAKVLGEQVAAKLGPPMESGPLRKFDAPTDKFFLSIHEVIRVYPTFEGFAVMPYKILDPAVFEAFGEHKCFLSIDVIPTPGLSYTDMHDALGKIAVEFMDDSCVCVYCRKADVYLKPDDELRRVLRGEGPKRVFEYFRDRRTFGVPGDDREFQEAIAEARRRWPEFLEMWRVHAPNGVFTVKGRFEVDENVEHMWLSVTRIEGDEITGTLGNKPHFATHLREGDSVTITVDQLTDWSYGIAGKGDGGFTDPTLRAISQMLKKG